MVVSPGTEEDINSRRAVVSGVGLLNTYLKLVPAEAVSAATKTALAELREKKPVVTVVYWLQGTAQSLVENYAPTFAVSVTINWATSRVCLRRIMWKSAVERTRALLWMLSQRESLNHLTLPGSKYGPHLQKTQLGVRGGNKTFCALNN